MWYLFRTKLLPQCGQRAAPAVVGLIKAHPSVTHTLVDPAERSSSLALVGATPACVSLTQTAQRFFTLRKKSQFILAYTQPSTNSLLNFLHR